MRLVAIVCHHISLILQKIQILDQVLLTIRHNFYLTRKNKSETHLKVFHILFFITFKIDKKIYFFIPR